MEPVQEEPQFPFPYPPYGVQKGFMNKLYQTLDKGGIGIFESPTGTGKSLSLICSALLWLKQHKRVVSPMDRPASLDPPQASTQHPSWVDDLSKKHSMKKLQQLELKKREKLARSEKRIHELAQANSSSKRARVEALPPSASIDVDEEFVVDWDSDAETEKRISSDSDSDSIALSAVGEANDELQIIFCSRTHSQLSQFVNEVRKTVFGQKRSIHPHSADAQPLPLPLALPASDENMMARVIAIGSRKTLCINSQVNQFSSVARINEKCQDMQKSRSGKSIPEDGPSRRSRRKHKPPTSSCPYLSKETRLFQDHVSVRQYDIEELAALGRKLHLCPYYGAKEAISDSELVVAPYASVLHRATRESLGISLKNKILIFDEAHNLVDAINRLYSITLTYQQLAASLSQVSLYRDKYERRLKPKNLIYISQLVTILKTMLKFLTPAADGVSGVHRSQDEPTSQMVTINDFMFELRIDNVNLFNLLRYCKEAELAKKLHGFMERHESSILNEDQSAAGEDDMPQSTVIRTVLDFIEALTNSDQDGRVLIAKTGMASQRYFKFVMLNPAVHFHDIVNQAYSVIFAGGTLQPLSEFETILSRVSADRLHFFSCDHVIPDENLLALSLSSGPTNVEFDFTFSNRSSDTQIDELGRVLLNMASVVPQGVVVFLPSYAYEAVVLTRWATTGLVDKLAAKKRIFREPRCSSAVEEVLQLYATAIQKEGGALLFSVVGGKMSEGINFSDGLGRCIVMVGLPFANLYDPELKEKMSFMDSQRTLTGNGLTGREYYENICMKAVNQSIGRAIRHINDFATIVLIDRRYSTEQICSKLPKWIASRLTRDGRFGSQFASLSKFFALKRKKGLL
eukprot:GILK01011837.1.p1 GENE.GILK01011837.1~~GILK01011837.1.p1  ORF type:complete len:858 (+),score=121.79 GILK01011837.1:230-2803(+)